MATTQVLLWLQEDTAATLRAQAAWQGVKLSTLADALLRDGLGLVSERDAATSALPAIEAVVRRVVAEQAQADTERLAALIVKACREASVGRWLTYGLIERMRGTEVAEAEKERAFTAASKVVRSRVAGDATAGAGGSLSGGSPSSGSLSGGSPAPPVLDDSAAEAGR